MTVEPLRTDDDWRELAHRAGDGLEISLLWSKRHDLLTVRVSDRRIRDSFVVPVADAEPLHVFEHPFAYAAFRGIEAAADCGGSELVPA